jgi:radical SAM superfamily enzyme YgiQ (UPF0313 family)
MLDIVIINVPGTISRTAPAAPAILKASIEKNGFTCKTIDFNIEFYHSKHANLKNIENYFLTELNTEVIQEAKNIVSKYVDRIIKLKPKFVGISVFTYQNKVATKLFCQELKKHTNIKIILGGQGLADGGILGHQGFAKQLLNENLIDFYIKSEGENSIVELLKGNFEYPGINSDTFQQIDNLDSLPIPDYSDYNLDMYVDSLPITGSRGCVRSCSFCDIHDHWSYKLRKGEAVANEIIELYKKYNIKNFMFTDSLVNGSLKEFKIFCKLLADFNRQNDVKLTYSGQYIVRSPSQLDDEYWKNLAMSGAQSLAIGVETGSDRVRQHMNKKFTNRDLDYTMEMLDRYNITCTFLMIFGYPTETEEDYQATLDMFKKYKKYANKIITNINFGSTLGILPGTPLFNGAQEFNIQLDRHENNWVALDNESLTLEERLRRRNHAKEYVLSLGYQIPDSGHDNVLDILKEHIPAFEKRNKIKKMIRIKEAIS